MRYPGAVESRDDFETAAMCDALGNVVRATAMIDFRALDSPGEDGLHNKHGAQLRYDYTGGDGQDGPSRLLRTYLPRRSKSQSWQIDTEFGYDDQGTLTRTLQLADNPDFRRLVRRLRRAPPGAIRVLSIFMKEMERHRNDGTDGRGEEEEEEEDDDDQPKRQPAGEPECPR